LPGRYGIDCLLAVVSLAAGGKQDGNRQGEPTRATQCIEHSGIPSLRMSSAFTNFVPWDELCYLTMTCDAFE
jgi:hypothetical protein